VSSQLIIERRYCGPPKSAQGGYTCGLLAECLDSPCVAVSLRLPPPLELRRSEDGEVTLVADDHIVADARLTHLQLDVPGPVTLEKAQDASANSPWADHHPFPDCFGCGPSRSQNDAVAIVTGPIAGGEMFAGPWTPAADFAAADGVVSPRFVWAALDCPTAAPAVPTHANASVLGRLTGCLLAPIRAEVPHVVVAWLIGHDGRKHRGGAAIYGPDGVLCAYSMGLWIELRDPSAMGAIRPAS
jgi:hypothetical protein